MKRYIINVLTMIVMASSSLFGQSTFYRPWIKADSLKVNSSLIRMGNNDSAATNSGVRTEIQNRSLGVKLPLVVGQYLRAVTTDSLESATGGAIPGLDSVQQVADSSFLWYGGNRFGPIVKNNPTGIAFSDSATYIAGSSATSHKWTQTVAGDYLVVGMSYPGDRRTDSVQVWNGAGTHYNMTKLYGNNVDQSFGTSFWGLVNPPTGVDTIKTWNLGEAGQGVGFSASYINVNQSTPVGAADSANGNSGTAAGAVTAAGATDLIVGAIGSGKTTAAAAWTPTTSGLVKRIEVLGAYDTFGVFPAIVLFEIPGTAGVTSYSGTLNATATWKTGGVALKP